jgi:ATP-dependent DNA helicase RecQ
LVYVRTRQDSEELAAWLGTKGYRAAAYHAGLPASDRRQREHAWIINTLHVVVATNAFGMGVNKPDLRWVLHFHVPSLLTEYVQEIGRAGRDGQPAQALSLVSERTGLLDPTDKQRSRFFVSQTQRLRQQASQIAAQIPEAGSLEDVQRQFKKGAIALSYLHSQGCLEWTDPFHYRLRSSSAKHEASKIRTHDIEPFLHSRDCRWHMIVRQFGFRQEAQRIGRCGHCDNCLRSRS